ncbi:hypothetical protein ACVMIX_006490 [Rhizobium leguminosarum]
MKYKSGQGMVKPKQAHSVSRAETTSMIGKECAAWERGDDIY